MRLPESINIFGADFKVQVVKDLRDDDGNRVDGLFCAKTSTISIDKNDKDPMHTLVHEMGHAMFYRVSVWQTGMEPQIEEIIVNNYASMMNEVFNLKFRRSK